MKTSTRYGHLPDGKLQELRDSLVAKGCTRDNSPEFREVDEVHQHGNHEAPVEPNSCYKDEETGSD